MSALPAAAVHVAAHKPGPEAWIRSFVALYLEVEAGLRPARHVRPFMAPDLQPVVAARGRQLRPPEMRSIRVQSRPGACEAVVLLEESGRIAALAIALRRDDHGWLVEEIRRPGCRTTPRPHDDGPSLAVRTWHEVTGRDPVPGWAMPPGWMRRAAA